MTSQAVIKESGGNTSGVLDENDAETFDGGLFKRQEGYAGQRNIQLVWRNIILFVFLHLAALYGLWLMLFSAHWKTGIFGKL